MCMFKLSSLCGLPAARTLHELRQLMQFSTCPKRVCACSQSALLQVRNMVMCTCEGFVMCPSRCARGRLLAWCKCMNIRLLGSDTCRLMCWVTLVLLYSMLLKGQPALPLLRQVVNWMPQNDVLGHQQTRAFLSQCGANSLYEVGKHVSLLDLCSVIRVPLMVIPCPIADPDQALKPCQACAPAPVLYSCSLLQLVGMQAPYHGVPHIARRGRALGLEDSAAKACAAACRL